MDQCIIMVRRFFVLLRPISAQGLRIPCRDMFSKTSVYMCMSLRIHIRYISIICFMISRTISKTIIIMILRLYHYQYHHC